MKSGDTLECTPEEEPTIRKLLDFKVEINQTDFVEKNRERQGPLAQLAQKRIAKN